MPNNIDHIIEIGDTGLFVTPAALEEMAKWDNLPETNFIEQHVGATPNSMGLVELQAINWFGEFSGSSVDTFYEALGKTVGSLEFILIYESGDVVGISVEDGEVTECEVEFTLTPIGDEDEDDEESEDEEDDEDGDG